MAESYIACIAASIAPWTPRRLSLSQSKGRATLLYAVYKARKPESSENIHVQPCDHAGSLRGQTLDILQNMFLCPLTNKRDIYPELHGAAAVLYRCCYQLAGSASSTCWPDNKPREKRDSL